GAHRQGGDDLRALEGRPQPHAGGILLDPRHRRRHPRPRGRPPRPRLLIPPKTPQGTDRMDVIVRNGTVVTASGVSKADIGIKDGKVVQIGGTLESANRIVDAKGCYVMPGGVDV